MGVGGGSNHLGGVVTTSNVQVTCGARKPMDWALRPGWTQDTCGPIFTSAK